MVAIEEVNEPEAEIEAPVASEERLLDAEELEGLLDRVKRPTAWMQLESLAKKIRKEARALKVHEASQKKAAAADQKPAAEPKPAPAPAPPKPIPASAAAATTSSSKPSATYTSIDRFAFDAGGSSDRFVTLYLPLPGVGQLKPNQEAVTSKFTKTGFDITVLGLDSKNYRLIRDNLEHEIVPDQSRHVIKKDKIVVKLAKKKAEYGGYDFWSKLTDPKKGSKSSGASAKKKPDPNNPMGGIMDMMKDMYDSGDDQMRKMIGETMLKQRNGELDDPKNMPGGGDLREKYKL